MPVDPPSGATTTVLIVDDTPANLALVVESLEQHGLRVVVAQDGEEGLKRAELVRPDLILLDVMMPRMDGFELCSRLKAQESTRDIPIIFMTSLSGTEGTLRGFKVGAVDYVTKPLHVEEVQARVGAHLTLRAMQKQVQAQNCLLQQEILERQQAELRLAQKSTQLTELNRELECFCYTVSHDLRAPLRAILGFAHLLEESAADLQRKREYLDKIVHAAQRMDAMIQDLLQYARTGERAIRMLPVPLAPIVQQLGGTFAQRLFAANAELKIQEPLATPLGDPLLIEQILTNLVDNALTYRCPTGRVEVSVSAKRRGERVELAVTDNGIGIAAEYHDKIFQVFQRLHTYQEYPGTGIGLAIVAKAARLMKGDVRVDSAPGKGSTFTVSLPAADS